MEITDIIRNALVDSGKFYKVQYSGNDNIKVESKDHNIEVKVYESEGLGALFG